MTSCNVVPRSIVAAHRGGALLWPENSLAAFRGALSLGVDQIETDVHLSSDDEPVVIHDATLDRTTVGLGPVRVRPWSELATVKIKGPDGGYIPHLDQLLALMRPSTVQLRLELKVDAEKARYPRLEKIAVGCLERGGMLERTIFTSFDWDYVQTLRSILPTAPFIGLVNAPRFKEVGGTEGIIKLALSTDVVEVSFPVDLLQKADVERAKADGIRLGVYGVRTEDQTRHALNCGAVAFTTDRPDIAIALRDRPTEAGAE